MKKTLLLSLTALLILGIFTTGAFAEESNQQSQPPQNPQFNQNNQQFYQQMWNFCHGPNGMMNNYYGTGNGQAAPQGYYGMGNMMGW